jgi:hypothetical protein
MIAEKIGRVRVAPPVADSNGILFVHTQIEAYSNSYNSTVSAYASNASGATAPIESFTAGAMAENNGQIALQ